MNRSTGFEGKKTSSTMSVVGKTKTNGKNGNGKTTSAVGMSG